MKTTRVPKLLFAIVLTVLLLSACGGDRTTSSATNTGGADSRDTNDSSPSPAHTTSPPAEDETTISVYEVWFHARERLAPVGYEHTATPRIGTAALEDLLSGPVHGDFDTSIPQGSELLELSIENGVATANLSSEFGATGGSYAERMRLAQVVYTLTQFPTVEGVLFEIDGDRVRWFGGHGLDVREPQTRADFEDLAPAIVIDSPRRGASVSSPVVITGNANVFEATVSIRILDSTGAILEETFTTATCGTGCRGNYEARVSFTVDQEQAGTLMVFESSAENGRPINVVKIPVRLLP